MLFPLDLTIPHVRKTGPRTRFVSLRGAAQTSWPPVPAGWVAGPSTRSRQTRGGR